MISLQSYIMRIVRINVKRVYTCSLICYNTFNSSVK